MSLFSLLSLSGRGLGVQRVASQTASHNLANASTPGYARQRAGLAATTSADVGGGVFVGRGVSLAGVQQSRDRFLEAQLPSAFSAAAGAEAEAAVLTSISQLAPELEEGLPRSLGRFYGALQQLAQDPSSPGQRAVFLEEARGLTLAFRRAAGDIDQSRRAVDAEVAASLPEVNDLAAQVAELNQQVRAARAGGGEPNDLLDARQRAADRLAELVGARSVSGGGGDISLVLPSGAALVSQDRAARLEALPDPANDGRLALRLVPSDGGAARPLPNGDLGGALGGGLAARDGALAEAAAGLDALAFELATNLNEVHQGGYGLDGGTGRDLLRVDTLAGAAASIEVAPELLADPATLSLSGSPGTLPGDNAQALLLLETERQPLSVGTPPAEALADTIARFGSAASRALRGAETESLVRDRLVGLRDSASGVSIDEELIELTKAQRAFEAMTKVVETTDRMLETLMSLR